MIASAVNVSSKDLLAKILATENLTVLHQKVHTAMFDTKNRVLYLPIWQDMEGFLYDMFVAHEISHALHSHVDVESEIKKLMAAMQFGKSVASVKSLLNVIEDIRIEKLIKNRYPGIRKVFPLAYQNLLARDFFGTKGKDVNKLGFLDRVNIYAKCGSLMPIKFTDAEKEILVELEAMQTWNDVILMAKKLYHHVQKENQNKDEISPEKSESTGSSKSKSKYDKKPGKSEKPEKDDKDKDDSKNEKPGEKSPKSPDEDPDETGEDKKEAGEDAGETGEDKGIKSLVGGENTDSGMDHFDPEMEIEVISETQEHYNKTITQLNDPKAKEIVYVDIPTANLNKIIIGHKFAQKEISNFYESHGNSSVDLLDKTFGSYIQLGNQLLDQFKTKNKNTINFLIQQFELRKAADQLRRTSISKTGKLNTSKLHAYRYSDDIFLSSAQVQGAKSHGLVIFIDWSGSMGPHIFGTIQQLLNIIMFARRENIPFEVYAFGNNIDDYEKVTKKGATFTANEGELFFANNESFRLTQYFSSDMTQLEFNIACRNMLILAHCMRSVYGGLVPPNHAMGGTPLNESIVASYEVIKKFKLKYGVQITNLVYITDGAGNSGTHVKIKGRNYADGGAISVTNGSKNFVFVDKVTRKEYRIDEKEYTVHVSETRLFGRGTPGNTKHATAVTDILIQILKDRYGIHAVNFYIAGHSIKHEIGFITLGTQLHGKDQISIYRTLKADRNIILKKKIGWSDYYVILGGEALSTETEIDLDSKMTSIQMSKHLVKFNKSNVDNRIILVKFIDMISGSKPTFRK